ncbi:MAG: gamma-glutamyl-gamma-aminobutyrate hydrolase family protein [Pseudomonadota bacterium]
MDANPPNNSNITLCSKSSHLKEAKSKNKPVLIIFHQENSEAGAVGQWFKNNGYSLDIKRPRFGDLLPASLENHSGVVVFGGPMSANDNEEYVHQEIDWLDIPLQQNMPILGICLGAQMLIKHLGGEVRKHDQGYVEVGYYPVSPTPAGKAMLPWPSYFYQWHTEGVILPQSVETLLEAEYFTTQAFRYNDKVLGVQFHPEITLAMIHKWTVLGAEKLAMPGAKERLSHFRDHDVYYYSIRKWLDLFLSRLMGHDH